MRSSTAIDRSRAGAEVNEQLRETTEQQFGRLLAANHGALGRLVASYARSVSDRDDLLQEIAIALWRALPGFRGDCSERTFLFRIAHNRCITHLSKRQPTLSLDDAQIEPVDPNASPEATLSEEQQRQRLVQAIHSLPVIHREVLILFLEGMEYKEIAEIVGISESNVGARLSRARQRLKTLLEGQS